MNKKRYFALFWMVLVALLVTGCGGDGGGSGDSGDANTPAVPQPYAEKQNPHGTDAAAVAAGKTLYDTNCASCHGTTGAGDGPAASALNPAPTDLSVREDDLDDDYLLWRISEGGAFAPFNSSMPAWKGILTEDQIWQTISYIRTVGE